MEPVYVGILNRRNPRRGENYAQKLGPKWKLCGPTIIPFLIEISKKVKSIRQQTTLWGMKKVKS